MPEQLPPGVFIDEVGTGLKPIEGVNTSIAGFLGPAERGPEDIRHIRSWEEYCQWFGGHLGVDKTYMSYAVQGFFINQGKQCYVGRIVKGAANNRASPASLQPRAEDSTTFIAIGRGEWGNNILVRVTEASSAKLQIANAQNWIRFQVLYFSGRTTPNPSEIVDPFNPDPEADAGKRRPDVVEDFDDLTMVRDAPNFFATAIKVDSKLVKVRVGDNPQLSPTKEFQPLTGGLGNSTRITDAEDYVGDLGPIHTADTEDLHGRGRGLFGMETIDDVSLLMAPDQVKLIGLTQKLVASCNKLKDRLAILSTKKGTKTNFRLSFSTTFGAMYHPWIWIYDPLTGNDQLVPATGHVAGIIVRTDIEQGVHKAPANAIVIGANDLEMQISKADQEIFNPIGVNCIRDFRSSGRGIRLWGARTMSDDPEWKYIHVRRLFLFIEKSLAKGTQWVAFEPNDERTWELVRKLISNFLMFVWRNGALLGAKPEEAFFVRCDRTTMDADDILNGRLICEVGLSPVRPAEFVVFRFERKTAESP